MILCVGSFFYQNMEWYNFKFLFHLTPQQVIEHKLCPVDQFLEQGITFTNE